MRKLIFIIMALFLFLIPDVYGQKGKKAEKVKADTLVVGKDSLEYDLIIIDPGFEAWLASKPSMEFRSNESYRSKNDLYVVEWNIRYLNPQRYGTIYETYIEYDRRIDYGIKLNYTLYYYFKYFEEKNRVVLIPQGK